MSRHHFVILPGEQMPVLHDCGAVRHVAPITVQRTLRLGSGVYRVEGTRCDGTAIHVFIDRDGREVEA